MELSFELRRDMTSTIQNKLNSTRSSCTISFAKVGTSCVLALDGERLAGAHFFYTSGHVYYPTGTFVAGPWQRHGIAKMLWTIALSETKTTEVRVCVVSDRGLTLVRSLEELFPEIAWTIYDDGRRPLRVLKKKRKRGKKKWPKRSKLKAS